MSALPCGPHGREVVAHSVPCTVFPYIERTDHHDRHFIDISNADSMRDFLEPPIIAQRELRCRWTRGKDGERRQLPPKLCAPSMAPYTLPSGTSRLKRNVLKWAEFWWVPLDIDSAPMAPHALQAVVKGAVAALGSAALDWSTFSSREGSASARLMLPLSRPSSYEEMCGAWWVAREALLAAGLPEFSGEMVVARNGDVRSALTIDPRVTVERVYYMPAFFEDVELGLGDEILVSCRSGPPLAVDEFVRRGLEVEAMERPKLAEACPGTPLPGCSTRRHARRGRRRVRAGRPSGAANGAAAVQSVTDELTLDTEEGVFSVAELHDELSDGEKVSAACPFAPYEASMGSMFVTKHGASLWMVCTAAGHGHDHASDGCSRWVWRPNEMRRRQLEGDVELVGPWKVRRGGAVVEAEPAQPGCYLPDLGLLLDAFGPPGGKEECTTPGWTTVLSLSAPMGAGKTRQIAGLVESGSVLALVHRRSLASTMANRLGLVSYLDKEGCLDDERMAVCLDSLDRVELRSSGLGPSSFGPRRRYRVWDTVILDEADQLFVHLYGGTIGGRSMEVLERLTVILRHAKRIVVADAHLTELTREMLFRLLDGLPVQELLVTMRPTDAHRRCWRMHDTHGACVRQLFANWGEGKSVAVAVNSKSEARALAVELQQRRPEAVVGLFNSEESNRKADEIAAFGTPYEGRYDAIVYTTTLGTGVSIDRRDYDRVFLLAGQGAGTAFDMLQLAQRVRAPRDNLVHAWVDGSKRWDEERPEVIKEALLDLRADDDAAIFEYVDGPFPSRHPRNEAHLDGLCQVRAYEARWSNLLRDRLVRHLQSIGTEVTWAEDDDEDASQLASKQVALARKALNTARARRVADAPDIPVEEALRVKQRGPESDEEACAADKALMRDVFGPEVEITPELAYADRAGVVRQQVKAYADMVVLLEGRGVLLAQSDLSSLESEGGSVVGVARTDLLRAEAVLGVLGEFGIIDPRRHVDPVTVPGRQFLGVVLASKAHYRALLGFTPPRNLLEAPMSLASMVLRTIGLKMKNSRPRGPSGRRRTYRIDTHSVLRMENLAGARIRSMVLKRRACFQEPRTGADPPISPDVGAG